MLIDIFSLDDERASRMTKLKSPTSDATKSEGICCKILSQRMTMELLSKITPTTWALVAD